MSNTQANCHHDLIHNHDYNWFGKLAMWWGWSWTFWRWFQRGKWEQYWKILPTHSRMCWPVIEACLVRDWEHRNAPLNGTGNLSSLWPYPNSSIWKDNHYTLQYLQADYMYSLLMYNLCHILFLDCIILYCLCYNLLPLLIFKDY